MDFHRSTSLTVYLLSILGYCAGQDALPPGPVNGTLGGNVIFKTTINPTTLLSIIWTFGEPPVSIVDFASSAGSVIGVGYVGRISLDNSTGSLELRKLTRIDSGTYRVSLRTAAVSQVGSTSLIVYESISGADITTIPNPPIIEGGFVNLTCDASGSIITREWMKDGHPLSAGGNITISEDKRVLSINPVKRTDSGEYLCRVSNPVSTANAKHGLIVNSEGSLSQGLSAGAIAGIVIGVLLILGVAVGVAVYFMKIKGFLKKESSRSVGNTGKSSANGGGPGGNQDLNYADITQFQKRDGGSVQLGNLGTSSTEYAQVRVNNRPGQPAEPPTNKSHHS